MTFNPVFDFEDSIRRKDFTSVYQSLMLIRDFHVIFNKELVDEPTAFQMFQYFSDENFDLNVQDRHGKTFLMYACDNDYRGVILHLCKHNANMELTDNEGHTAFDLVNNKPFSVENDKIKDILCQYYKPQKRDVAPRTQPMQTSIDTSVFFKEKCNVERIQGLPIFFYDVYQPYEHGTNPLFNDFSRMILAYKRKEVQAMAQVEGIFTKIFNKNFSMACVPSSTVGKTNLLPLILKRLSSEYNIADATSCLQRIETIPASHLNGNRSYYDHMRTIRLRDQDLIKDKDILLFDDIVSTGSSMRACCDILRPANPKSIVFFCLGRTANRSNNY